MPSFQRTRTKYTRRPPAANRAARTAWDALSQIAACMEPPRQLQCMWRSYERQCWSAHLNEIDANERSPYLDIDIEDVRERMRSAHLYAANDPQFQPNNQGARA